ncbi:hypothetical protein ELI24_31165 (plasmid) [Rhizobium ruizarguesonis]|nr:hypothetical protein ELI24_31165 [Rhizobium ruizarguesonis]TAX63701.1 hypothetical protein ELI00_36910 [Rhizobium ruizarguesonis]
MHSRCGSRCTARASLGQTMIELVRTMSGVDLQRSWEGRLNGRDDFTHITAKPVRRADGQDGGIAKSFRQRQMESELSAAI